MPFVNRPISLCVIFSYSSSQSIFSESYIKMVFNEDYIVVHSKNEEDFCQYISLKRIFVEKVHL